MTGHKNQRVRTYENLECLSNTLFFIGKVLRIFKRRWINSIFVITVNFSVIFINPLIAQDNSSGLRIHPNNPHYFTYNGRSTYLLAYGNDREVASDEGYYSSMSSAKLNHKIILLITATDRDPSPYNNKNINNGWDESTWTLIKNNVRWARDRNIIIGIMLWSSPIIEQGSGRWDLHLWNEKNGGPIPNDGDGKDEFYTLDSYGSEISGPYNSSWSWQRKNQFRQEEFVKKYLTELKDFPNVYFIPMFEIGDFYGSSLDKAHRWHQHIAGLIKKYQPNRLIAVQPEDEKVAGWPEADFFIFQGPGLAYVGANKDLRDAYWSYNKPLVWIFSHPGTSRFPGGDKSPLEKMRNAVIYGLQATTKSRAGGAQNDYARALANFLSTVETWCDEPGQEITKDTVPATSGGGGVDLPRGGCSDSVGGGSDPDSTPPLPPQGVKVSN